MTPLVVLGGLPGLSAVQLRSGIARECCWKRYAVFTKQWSTYHNRLSQDFEIFGSVEEMYRSQGNWTFCPFIESPISLT